LEPLAGLRTARLLALHGARIAREEPEVAQLAPVGLVELHERARGGEAQRAGLPALPAPLDGRLHIVAAETVGGREWLLDARHQRGTREIIAERAPVHIPLPRAGAKVQTADALLAPSDRVHGGVRHHFFPSDLRVRTFGCCAWCGCSAPA